MKRIVSLIGFAPYILAGAYYLGLIPEQYAEWAKLGLVACAVLYCVALAYGGKHAMDLALLPALYCVLLGGNAAYDYFKSNYGTFWQMLDAFCCFVCGIWIFAHTLKKENK